MKPMGKTHRDKQLFCLFFIVCYTHHRDSFPSSLEQLIDYKLMSDSFFFLFCIILVKFVVVLCELERGLINLDVLFNDSSIS